MKLDDPSSNDSRAVSSVEVDCEESAASESASSTISPSALSVAGLVRSTAEASSGWTMLVPADSTIALNQTTSPS